MLTNQVDLCVKNYSASFLFSKTGLTNMIETRSRSYIILSILFLLALAIRLIYLFELSRIPIFDTVLSVMDHYNFDQGVALHEMSRNMGKISFSRFVSTLCQSTLSYASETYASEKSILNQTL